MRRWFGHEPRRWASFAAKYRAELEHRADVLRLLDEARRRGRVTLLYGARDAVRNHATVLRRVAQLGFERNDLFLPALFDHSDITS